MTFHVPLPTIYLSLSPLLFCSLSFWSLQTAMISNFGTHPPGSWQWNSPLLFRFTGSSSAASTLNKSLSSSYSLDPLVFLCNFIDEDVSFPCSPLFLRFLPCLYLSSLIELSHLREAWHSPAKLLALKDTPPIVLPPFLLTDPFGRYREESFPS